MLVALVVYVATWTGWLMHSSQYVEYLSNTQYTHYVSGGSDCGKNITFDNDKHWPTADQPVKHGLAGLVQGLESLAYYHHDVYVFHTHFLTGAPTPTPRSRAAGCCSTARSASTPRPASSPASTAAPRPKGSDCLRQVLLLGTPAVWWGGVAGAVLRAGDVGRRP